MGLNAAHPALVIPVRERDNWIRTSNARVPNTVDGRNPEIQTPAGLVGSLRASPSIIAVLKSLAPVTDRIGG